MKFLSNSFPKGGLLVAIALLLCNFAFAQRTVKGKVTDSENGEGLIGATVSVVGTPRGSVTDIDGNYSVAVPDGATQLRFSYTGFTEQTITLAAANVVDVALVSGTKLDEVVVVGYGTLKSREITSSVARVKAEDFNKGNVVDVAQLLQGKVAGLTISRPGGDPNSFAQIRLRGLSTFGPNSSPLVVIDGVPGQNLNSIDPNDIETVDVLKDGSASAIYGTRGSSGVIIVTTKKGQAGKSAVTYSGLVSFDNIERKVNVLDGSRYVSLAGGSNLGANTNWLDEVTQTGKSQTHSMNLSGGTAATSYRATLSYRDVDGIARTSGFKQYNGTMSITQKAMSDRLNLSANFGINNRDADLGFADAFRYATIYNPTAPIKNANGSYYEIGGFEQFNPVAIIEQNTNKKNSNTYFGNLRAELKLFEGFSLSGFVNRSNELNKNAEFYSKTALFRSGNRGLARAEEFRSRNDLFETTANYGKKFGKLDFKALAGYSWQKFDYAGWLNQAGGVGVDNFGIDNFGAYADFKAGTATTTSYHNDNTLIAQFGRVNFNYDDTYFITGSLRREGSSRFGENNKWGLFPAVSGGIALDKLATIGGFNSLKLRAGFGVTGSIPPESYLSIAKVSPTGNAAYIDGGYLPAWGFSGTNANPDLKWETKSDINVGFDFALLDYKLTGSLEYYKSTVSDLIFEITANLPPNLGPTTWANVGKLENSGIELALSYAVNSKWTTSLAATKYFPTKLLEFYQNFKSQEYAVVGAPGQNSFFYQTVSVLDGENELGNFIAVDVARVGTDGKYVYHDATGAETTDLAKAGKINAGNGIPKYELGWTNTFTHGNWDAQIFLRSVLGHSLAHEFRAFYESLGDNNGWNKVDTKYFDANNKANNSYSSRTVEKADFLRLDNMTIGYTFKLPTDSWFTKARVFFNGQQLFTLTGYSGVDPSPRFVDAGPVDNGNREATVKSPLTPGIDRRNTYFTARTLNLGVNFGF